MIKKVALPTIGRLWPNYDDDVNEDDGGDVDDNDNDNHA